MVLPKLVGTDVTIRIRIRIAYVQNYASVVQPTFQHILGCCCLFGGPAASHVVNGYYTWLKLSNIREP
eukprot:10511570-Ditylum_brightwellii.AAC.1